MRRDKSDSFNPSIINNLCMHGRNQTHKLLVRFEAVQCWAVRCVAGVCRSERPLYCTADTLHSASGSCNATTMHHSHLLPPTHSPTAACPPQSTQRGSNASNQTCTLSKATEPRPALGCEAESVRNVRNGDISCRRTLLSQFPD